MNKIPENIKDAVKELHSFCKKRGNCLKCPLDAVLICDNSNPLDYNMDQLDIDLDLVNEQRRKEKLARENIWDEELKKTYETFLFEGEKDD